MSERIIIPVTASAAFINVQKELTNERLGRLRKQHGFHMDNLRKYIHYNTDKK